MTIRCLIVDDEEPARREMAALLADHGQVEVVGLAATVASALELTTQLKPDLVFLDIQLAGKSGFDYAARIGEAGPPRIVFVTAYDQFSLNAFECNALDYLLKPVHPERLAQTLRRASALIAPERRASADDVVYLKAGALARLVPWREVRYISTQGNYTRVSLEDGTEPLVARTFKDWLAFVPEKLFQQIHRTTLVRLDVIREVIAEGERRQLRLSDDTLLPVSRAHWPALKLALERR